MKRIRVGIIGQGRSGYDIHVDALRKMPGRYKIVAVCDPLEERTAEAVRDLGSIAYRNYKDMLKRDDLDLIVNATPSHLHLPVTMEALDAGFNVLCEKPFARRVAEVDSLIAKSRETGKLLAAYQQSRFAPYFRQVRKVLDSGVLGRIVMVKIAFAGYSRRWDWQTLQEYNGGGLMNTGPHPLDQALQLFGTDVMPKVTCIMDKVNSTGDAEDHIKLLLTGKGRPTIDLEVSGCSAYPGYTYQIYAEYGGLTGDMRHLEWKYFKPEEAPELKLDREPLPGRAYPSEQLKWYTKSWDIPKSQFSFFRPMAIAFYINLYSALTQGTPLEISLEDVRRQIEVIEECHRQNPLPRLG